MSILSVQDISKRYKFREVVKGISLEISSGEVVETESTTSDGPNSLTTATIN